MRIFRLLAVGQFSFFICLAVCTALIPHFAKTGGGVSNYGLYAKTIPFYTLGFALSAITAIWAGTLVKESRLLGRSLIILGILMLAVLASTYPYKVNTTFDFIHQGVSQVLFVFEVWFGVWLAFYYRDQAAAKLLFIAQCVSALIALLTILGLFHLLFISQILTGLSFGALLLYATRRTV